MWRSIGTRKVRLYLACIIEVVNRTAKQGGIPRALRQHGHNMLVTAARSPYWLDEIAFVSCCVLSLSYD